VWETIKIPIRPTSETSLNKTGVNLIVIENIKSSKVKTIYVDMYFYKSNNNGENIKTKKMKK
jgi:hypothetical protein